MAKNVLPEHIGNYKITKELGRGSMGTVYLGTQESLGREVAIKVLAPEFTRDEEFLERFKREARAAVVLRHPNIVQVFDLCAADEQYYITMEYLGPMDLRRLLTEQGGKLPLNQALMFGEQLLSALEHAHAKGIIHRDVKPANILISDQGQAILTDFSVAQMKFASRLTQTGAAVGTPEYMAPEQYESKGVDSRADLYAAGIILYEMATGVQPFHGETVAEVMRAQLFINPPDIDTIDPSLPPELTRIVHRSLEKDRNVRYSSATEMLVELRRLRSLLMPPPPPEPKPQDAYPARASLDLGASARDSGSSGVLAASLGAAKVPLVSLDPAQDISAPAAGRLPRFCPGCAQPVVSGHRHCANCGFEIGSLVGRKEEMPSPQAPLPQAPLVGLSEPARADAPVPKPAEPLSKKPLQVQPRPILAASASAGPPSRLSQSEPPVRIAGNSPSTQREEILDLIMRIVGWSGLACWVVAVWAGAGSRGHHTMLQEMLIFAGVLGVPCLTLVSMLVLVLEVLLVRKLREILRASAVCVGLGVACICLLAMWLRS